jgi:hypothetical protein
MTRRGKRSDDILKKKWRWRMFNSV